MGREATLYLLERSSSHIVTQAELLREESARTGQPQEQPVPWRIAREQREYAILTAEISKATFGLTPSQYAEFKRLKRENLRDHMTDLELIFSMLGEASTTEIARTRDTQGFPKNKRAALVRLPVLFSAQQRRLTSQGPG